MAAAYTNLTIFECCRTNKAEGRIECLVCAVRGAWRSATGREIRNRKVLIIGQSKPVHVGAPRVTCLISGGGRIHRAVTDVRRSEPSCCPPPTSNSSPSSPRPAHGQTPSDTDAGAQPCVAVSAAPASIVAFRESKRRHPGCCESSVVCSSPTALCRSTANLD